MLGENKQILHKHDCLTVTHGAGKANKRFLFIGCEREQRLYKAATQRIGRVRIGRPADRCVQRQDLLFPVGLVIPP